MEDVDLLQQQKGAHGLSNNGIGPIHFQLMVRAPNPFLILLAVRVRSAKKKLAQTSARRVGIFGHGHFLQAMRWMIASNVGEIDSQAMHGFNLTRRIALPMPKDSFAPFMTDYALI